MRFADFAFADEVAAFLAEHRTAGLATADADGTPHAANVQYAFDPADFSLWWVSSPGSLHSRHLLARPACAVTVYAPVDDRTQIHGVQMHGRVDPPLQLTDAGWAEAFERYADRFPFVRDDAKMRAAVESQALYRFAPTWLRWIDNRRGFGFKAEAEF